MNTSVDSTSCSSEPIHIPGHIQSHGVLLVLKEPGLTIVGRSSNAESLLGITFTTSLDEILTPVLYQQILTAIGSNSIERINPFLLKFKNSNLLPWTGILHRNCQNVLILEMEPLGVVPNLNHSFYREGKANIEELQKITKLETLKDFIVAEVRRLTGFDRVMLYIFDEKWNGEVTAESHGSGVESFLNFRFPHTDIPEQARRLYTQNLLRFIADAKSIPSPLVSDEGRNSEPLDLTQSVLRSVSPIHIEYLKNMGVDASMSISVLREGKLWGLIACHHRVAKQVAYETRIACEFLTRIFSYELVNLEEREVHEHRKQLKAIRASLSHRLPFSDPPSALLEGITTAVDLLSADGAAILLGGKIHCVGMTPNETQLSELAAWLRKQEDTSHFSTSRLSEVFEPAAAYSEDAAGMLAIKLSKGGQDLLLVFRREIIKVVRWSGNPNEPRSAEQGETQLHPRKSFAEWKEIMRGSALTWKEAELELASELKDSILFEQLIGLNNSLEEKIQDLGFFAHVASHDLKEPLRTVSLYVSLIEKQIKEGPSADLKKYAHHAGNGAKRMSGLIDRLAQFSISSAAPLALSSVDLNTLVKNAIDDLAAKINDTSAKITFENLPTLLADPVLFYQVFQNLISNALTYRSALSPTVHLSLRNSKEEWIIEVRDNGMGVAMANRERIFNLYYRVNGEHGANKPGSGLGLAICKRIIERHHGRIWYEPAPVQGSCFKIGLPRLSSVGMV